MRTLLCAKVIVFCDTTKFFMHYLKNFVFNTAGT